MEHGPILPELGQSIQKNGKETSAAGSSWQQCTRVRCGHVSQNAKKHGELEWIDARRAVRLAEGWTWASAVVEGAYRMVRGVEWSLK